MTTPAIRGIDPDQVYSLREAARLLPGPRPGVCVHPHTLFRWFKAGTLPLVRRPRGTGGKCSSYVKGADLLALFVAVDAPAGVKPAGPRPLTARQEAARRKAQEDWFRREFGMKAGGDVQE